MVDAPKLKAFATAMLFGEPPNCYLAICASVDPSIEIATARATDAHRRRAQERGIYLPALTMIQAMEIEDGLIQAYANTGKAGVVVPLRTVEPT